MHDSSPPAASRLQSLWLCEAIRRHEQHNPPLEDSEACRVARQQGRTDDERILLRNLALARREGLTGALQHWLAASRWLGLLLVALALLTGSALAVTAFNRTADSLNVIWVLLGLLGVHLLTLLLWLAGMIWRPQQPSHVMQLPLGLLERLSRSPAAGQLSAALLALLGRHGLLAAALSRLVHGWWTLTLLTALLVALLLLGTHRYAFAWETTIASADTFVTLVQGLGWPLRGLGFAVPDAALIRTSGEQILADELSRQVWASWLIGMLVVYGLLPRLLLALWFQWRWQRGRRRLKLDASHADWQWLYTRLQPATSGQIVDPQPQQMPQLPTPSAPALDSGLPCLAGLELEQPLNWPVSPPDSMQLLGNLDGYPAQQALLERLAGTPCSRMILACDARRSPDRGSLYFMGELARHCGQLQVWLLHGDTDPQRLEGWQQALTPLGITHSTRAPWLTEDGHV